MAALAGLPPVALPASRPAPCASPINSASCKCPFAEPATETKPSPLAPKGGRSLSGRKCDCASSQISLPPQWDHRCTTGDQPPDIATTSHSISSSTPPSPACAQSAMPVTRLPPLTFEIALPFSTRMPSALASSAKAPAPPARASMIQGTSRPRPFKVIAVR